MSKPKLTPWFDGKVKPARVGVYLRHYWTGAYYSHWDGDRWCGCAYRANEVATSFISTRQDIPWRGLAEQPK